MRWKQNAQDPLDTHSNAHTAHDGAAKKLWFTPSHAFTPSLLLSGGMGGAAALLAAAIHSRESYGVPQLLLYWYYYYY